MAARARAKSQKGYVFLIQRASNHSCSQHRAMQSLGVNISRDSSEGLGNHFKGTLVLHLIRDRRSVSLQREQQRHFIAVNRARLGYLKSNQNNIGGKEPQNCRRKKSELEVERPVLRNTLKASAHLGTQDSVQITNSSGLGRQPGLGARVRPRADSSEVEVLVWIRR